MLPRDVSSGAYDNAVILDIEKDIEDYLKVTQFVQFGQKDIDEVLFQIVDAMEPIDAESMCQKLSTLPDPNLIENPTYLENEYQERKLKEVILKTGLAVHNALFMAGLLDPQYFGPDGARFVYKTLVSGAPLLVILPEGQNV